MGLAVVFGRLVWAHQRVAVRCLLLRSAPVAVRRAGRLSQIHLGKAMAVLMLREGLGRICEHSASAELSELPSAPVFFAC